MSLSFRPVFAWALIAILCSTFVSLFFSFQAGVFVALFAVVGWWAAYNPHTAAIALVVIAPLLPMFKVTNTIGTITLIKDVVILVLLTVTVVIPLLLQRLPYRRNPLAIPLAMLMIWTGFEILLAQSKTLGILRARDIVLYIFFFLAVLYLPFKKGFVRELLMWFLGSATVVMLLGIYQWFFALDSAVLRFDPARKIWIPRLSSTLAHPSVFGHYLITIITTVAAVGLTYIKRWVSLLSVVMGISAMIFVYLTYSRAVWIGLAVALITMAGVYMLRHLQMKPAWVTTKGVLGVGIILIFLGGVGLRYTSANVFIRSIFDPTYKSNEARLEFLARLIAPTTNLEAIVGQGLGDVVVQNLRTIDVDTTDIASGDVRSIQLSKDATLVDNQYLKTFIEMGLIGLILYAWIYILVGKQAYTLTDRSQSAQARSIGYLGLGFLAAFVVQGFFIDIWEIFPTNLFFWLIAALVFRAATPQEKNHE